jgi:hypothetical protein
MVTQQKYDRLLKKYNNLLKRTKRKDILLKRLRSKLNYYLNKLLNEKKNNSGIVSRNKDLEKENKLLKEEKNEDSGLKKISREQVIFLCVFLVVHCRVSYRSVPKILAALCSCLNLMMIIPDRTSIMNWVKQVSLYKLKNIKKSAYPFLIIIDVTIKKGCAKLMTVLRMPLNVYEKRLGGISISEVEVVAIFASKKWDKYIVCEKLYEIFKKIGKPVQLILDGGGDLNAGVNLLKQNYPEFKGIHIVKDITHLFANLLKNKYKDSEIFKLFTKGIKTTGALLRQTKLSSLCPPKLRSIGRFQSIIRSVEWALNAINFYKINKRDVPTKYQKLLLKSFSWLIEIYDFLKIFRQECTLLNSIQKLVKIHGINQNIYKTCMDEINNSKISQEFKEKIIVILKKYLRSASLLSQKINVSSDVIESLFGVYKLIFERSKSTDIASSALYLPILSGELTQKLVSNAINNCSINDVKNWEKENLPETEFSKRKKLPKIFRPEPKLKAA